MTPACDQLEQARALDVDQLAAQPAHLLARRPVAVRPRLARLRRAQPRLRALDPVGELPAQPLDGRRGGRLSSRSSSSRAIAAASAACRATRLLAGARLRVVDEPGPPYQRPQREPLDDECDRRAGRRQQQQQVAVRERRHRLLVVSGTDSAAASGTTPRVPAHDVTAMTRNRRGATARSSVASSSPGRNVAPATQITRAASSVAVTASDTSTKLCSLDGSCRTSPGSSSPMMANTALSSRNTTTS